MVSDREITVWQDKTEYGSILKIQSRYVDDPPFTLEQESALHEIARAMLIANRKKDAEKRKREKAKERRDEKKIRSAPYPLL